MSHRNADEDARRDSLRQAYENAFRELRSEVSILQSLSANSNGRSGNATSIEEARTRIRDAQKKYREIRDELAEALSEPVASR